MASGDSYTRNGFNYKGTQPSASNPIGNPTFPGATTTGGLNWVEYAITAYNSTLVLSYDFAKLDATVDSTIVPAYTDSVPSLVNQVSQFTGKYATRVGTAASWTSENSLFTVWFGINDIMNGYHSDNWTTTVAPLIVDRYVEQAQVLYDNGARSFLFLSVPPLQRTPQLLAENATQHAEISGAVATYNALLLGAVSGFERANPDAISWLLNTTEPFDSVLDNPAAFGAPNDHFYSKTGTMCLWWIDFHTGQAIHKAVAESAHELTGI